MHAPLQCVCVEVRRACLAPDEWVLGVSAGRLDAGHRIELCEGVARACLGVRDARCDEAGATIYDNALLRKWVLGARLATASFIEIAGKSVLGRRGEGDLARVVCGMK